jgi:hypothetical protein
LLNAIVLPQSLDGPAVKTFYSNISQIFKKYYSRKNNQNWLSKTTGDLLLQLQAQVSSPDLVAQTAHLLRSADAVKFAKYLPEHVANEEALASAKTLIGLLEKKILI